MKEHDLERANRKNFRNSLEAMARPGEIQPITPLFGSGLLAMASVLLYAEVSCFYQGNLDFELIRAICGARTACREMADYLFFDSPDPAELAEVKTGTAESPEQGATLLFDCSYPGHEETKVRLSGPGIDGTKKITLPVTAIFLARLAEKNESFPMGIDLFFIDRNNMLFGLPRTTRIEVIQ